MHSLTELIDAKLSLQISRANAISDSGIIIGVATDASGDSFAVRLIPRDRLLSDLDCDSIVGASDLQMLIGHWGTCLDKISCPADFNSNGFVNGFDLAILLGCWS